MYIDNDLGGQWIYGPAHENFKAVLSYLNKLWNAGLLDPDYASMTKDLWAEKLSSGQAMCTIDNDGVVRNYNVALATIDPSAAFGVIPTLTNSLGETRNTSYANDRPANQWVISASSDKIDLAIKFLDWCYSEEGTDVNNLGKEGVSYEVVDGKKVFKEEVLAKYAANGANAIYDMSSELGIGLLEFTPRYDTTPDNQMALYL
jgi:putative aldouronate transport system substrate-binding protein